MAPSPTSSASLVSFPSTTTAMEPSLKLEEDLLPIPTSSSTPKPSPKKLGFFQSLVKGPGFLGLYIHPVLLFLIGGSILLYGQRSSISSYFSNHVNGYLSTTAPLPPTSISWGPCPDRPANETRFSCGFVEVPLDHAKGYAGGSAHVALSKFSVEKGVKKRGTVFVNPGGEYKIYMKEEETSEGDVRREAWADSTTTFSISFLAFLSRTWWIWIR